MYTLNYYYWLALPVSLTIRSYFNFFFTDTWKGTNICHGEIPHTCMFVLFYLLADCYFFLMMKRCQGSSNWKSSQPEFNIKLATLQPYKILAEWSVQIMNQVAHSQCMYHIHLLQSHWNTRTVISQYLWLLCDRLVSFRSCMSMLPKVHSSCPWLLMKKALCTHF